MQEVACSTDDGGKLRFPGLAALAAPIHEGERSTMAAIQECVRNGYITDAASEHLTQVCGRRLWPAVICMWEALVGSSKWEALVAGC